MNRERQRNKEDVMEILMGLIETRRRSRQSQQSLYYLKGCLPDNHPNVERMKRIAAEDKRKYANAWISVYTCINEPFGHEDIELMGMGNGRTV